MFKWIKKHSYWALAIAVLIVAVIAIGAYAWNFRELAISTDTGKWADFATYLSGTVGVAAVVATLMAFVITLRQQQKLIDSQDKMIIKQNKQIKISKKQLKAEEMRRQIELAHNKAAVLFPPMFNDFVSYLGYHVSPFQEDDLLMDGLVQEFGIIAPKARDFISNPGKVKVLIGRVEVSSLCRFIYMNYKKAYSLLEFMMDCIDSDFLLEDYFDMYLDKEDDVAEEYKFYFLCWHAYLVGLEREDVGDAVLYLRMLPDYKGSRDELAQWQEIGELIKPLLPVE